MCLYDILKFILFDKVVGSVFLILLGIFALLSFIAGCFFIEESL